MGSWIRKIRAVGRLKKHLGGRISRTWWWIDRGPREGKLLRMALRILAFWLKYLGKMCGPYWERECPRSGGRHVGESQRAGECEQKEFLRQAGQFWVSTNTGVSWGWWWRWSRGEDQDQPGSLIIKSFWKIWKLFEFLKIFFFPYWKNFLLLSYNIHTIQFTSFTCTIPWFLVYLQSCVAITTGMEFLFFMFFVMEHVGILVPWPGIEPVPAAEEAWRQTLDHQESPEY